MSLGQWASSHRRSLLFLIVALALAGGAASFGLPVALFPRVMFPRVVVSLDAGDRPADRMAIEVTRPVEEAVRAVPGVKSLRSTSSRGSAEISINFDWSIDMLTATLQVSSVINEVRGELPDGTSFEVRRMDPTTFPVLAYSLTSSTRSQSELYDIAAYQLRPALSTVNGVASVGVLGGAVEEYQVLADPGKLAAYGLTLADVAEALSTSNVVTAVGRVEQDNKLYLTLSNTQITSFDEIGRTIVSTGSTGFVLLSDVAAVVHGREPNWTRVTADGREAVLFQVYQQPGGNTVQIAARAREEIATMGDRLPADVQIAKWYDQSDLIVASANSVFDAVLIGVLLAAFVLFVFLRNLKVTLIAALTVPVVLASSVVLLQALGMSFNIMTLGGMAAAVGLIVDDAIVMIEHVVRRMQEGVGSYHERIFAAVAEFTRPLAGSSASTIVIFVPLAFLSGVTGAFFKALSITMAASLVISFFVAWIGLPVLALLLLNDSDTESPPRGAFEQWLQRTYRAAMSRLLERPRWVVLPVAAFAALGWFAYQQTGSGFMPSMDEGGFILDYRAEPGTSLAETDRMLRQVDDIVRATPEVETYSRRTGVQLGGGLTEANEGDYFVKLKGGPRRPLEDVMNDIRKRVEHDVPGVQIEMALLMEDLIGDLTAVPQPIEVKLYSEDPTQLLATAPKVAAIVGKVDGVVDVSDGVVLAGDALDIRVDREKAALEGMTPGDVTDQLAAAIAGTVTTSIMHAPKMIGIRAWLPEKARGSISSISDLQLRAADGHRFKLSRVASITRVTGQPQITRDDLKRMVAVTARISGRDMGTTVGDVKKRLDAPGALPHGVYYRLGGLYEQQRIAFRGLIAVLAAAVALVFALLLFLYESFSVAVAMLLNTVFALAAVFVGLWATGIDLNISAMMGMTMIVGIVTEVAIFLYSEFQELEGEFDDPLERLVEAGINRIRPISMTTLAAICALLPIAVGGGPGNAMQRPLAVAIISGLLVQVPLVLGLLPALLVIGGVGKKAPKETPDAATKH